MIKDFMFCFQFEQKLSELKQDLNDKDNTLNGREQKIQAAKLQLETQVQVLCQYCAGQVDSFSAVYMYPCISYLYESNLHPSLR